MIKTHSSTDISQLRKNRHLRINYEHRYYPGEMKKQLSAEDVILGRYKYIPPIKLAEKEKTRTFIRSKQRKSIVSVESILTSKLPPIEQRRLSVNSNSKSANDSSTRFGQSGSVSEIPRHPVIVIDVHKNVDKNVSSSEGNRTERNGSEDDDGDNSETDLDISSKDNDENDDDIDKIRTTDRDKESDNGATDEGDLSDGSYEKETYKEKMTNGRTLTTPDFDTDLENSDDAETDELTGLRRRKKKLHKSLRTYYRSCNKSHVTPNKSFVRQCGKGTVDLRHRLLTHVEVRPIAVSLVNEHRTNFLDISLNPLGPIGTECLSQVLLQNSHIVELNLSSTYPQRGGLESLVNCLGHNRTLRRLYLDKNELQPSEGDVIAKLIEVATSLLELHLAHNNLGFGGINQIARALVLAKGKLKVLNLSYNNIRTDSAVQLAKALAKNKTLQTLDISWNGFGEAGCKALSTSLVKNTSLKRLDLKCNRIGLKSLPSLIRGIVQNKGLHSISISSNPLTTEGAKALLSALIANKNPSQLTRIDLTGIPVDQEFLVLKARLEESIPLHVLHEETVSLGTSDMSRASTGTFLDNYNPVMTMFEFMKKDNLRVIDMFQFFDIQKRDKLSKNDLAAGFKILSIPFTQYQIDVIVTTLDTDKDGFVSLDEMVKGYNKNDKTVKSRRIKASMNKTTDRGLENLWAYLKTLISKRKENNAKKMAISSQARRSNFLAESNSTTNNSNTTTNNSNTPSNSNTNTPRAKNGNLLVLPGVDSRKTSVSQKPVGRKTSVFPLPT